MKRTTRLTPGEEQKLKDAYAADLLGENSELPERAYERPTKDVLAVLCQYGNKFLLGRVRHDKPDDAEKWDVPTKRLRTYLSDQALCRYALELPAKVAGIEVVRMIGSYNPFVWHNPASDAWLHVMAYHVQTNDSRARANGGRFSDFRWVIPEDITEFMGEDGYLRHFRKKTLGSGHANPIPMEYRS